VTQVDAAPGLGLLQIQVNLLKLVQGLFFGFARLTTSRAAGLCHPQSFFFFFWRIFLGFFDLQLMEDIKDGKEEVLDEVVMEHIK